MTLSSLTNIVTALLCFAVLIQSARLMRGLKQVRGTDMSRMVVALDEATVSAQGVLAELHRLLSGPLAGHAADTAKAEELRDELATLVGIADAMAERLSTASSSSATPAPEPQPLALDPYVTEAKGDPTERLRAIMQAWPRRSPLAEAA